jgi:hypothetical protein
VNDRVIQRAGEFGRGYRFIGMLRSNSPAAFQCPTREKPQSDRTLHDHRTISRVLRCEVLRAAISASARRHADDHVY